jgi:Ca2+-transporting ATPase
MSTTTPPIRIEGLQGLTAAEALKRLQDEGPNELPAAKPRGLGVIVLEVVREPMFLMLVAAGVVYLVLGEPVDASMLLGFVFVVMGITIVQARRTEQALEALRALSSPRALVVRDGERRRIPGREVVRGDLVVVVEGDRVPADAWVRQSAHLAADESLLTGESAPVRKVAAPEGAPPALDPPGGDDHPAVYSGTLVTSGQALVEVVSTGAQTAIGRIGSALARIEPVPTMLEVETRRIVRRLAITGLLACVVVVLVYALTRGGGVAVWKQGFLAGVTMAMALLPEEFPVVLTVFLALGAWRLSRSRVLTRRMPAVEMLGAATVLCVDKTGTLTQNRMTLRTLSVGDETLDLSALPATEATLPETLHAVLEHAILASRRDPFDPMERALHAAGDRFLAGTEHRHPGWVLAREYPLSPDLLAVSHAWRTGEGEGVVVSTKGAPEAVATLCRLDAETRARVDAAVATLAARGLRVLAVARTDGALTAPELPEAHSALAPTLVGLLGFEDPLRDTVPAAVAECRAAGVRVVMITGDSPETALSIARSAGLARTDTALTGAALRGLNDPELAARVGDVDVFARMVPEQKLRIVQALVAKGEIVAMTGDGVNDAPALKAAHIGIAMGERGTDVAREAASLVLLDDDFSSIVGAVKLGRRIYDNIRKAIAFIVAVHVPIAGLSIVPVFFGDWPLLLLPVHIAFLQLIIDPACTLIFEAEAAEPDAMRRPPRDRAAGLFSRQTLGLALLQGFSILAVCLGVFVYVRDSHTADAARAATFVTLVVAFVVVILVDRSWTQSAWAMLRVPNPAVRWVLAGAVVFLAAALLVPFLRKLFHFEPLPWPDLGLAFGAGFLCVLWSEGVKRLRPGA